MTHHNPNERNNDVDAMELLARQWTAAKNREETARLERVRIEENMIKLHPAKEEGSETVTTSDGTKIKLTGKLIYKADVDKLTVLTSSWPEEARPIKVEVKADETKLKAIRQERPDLWKKIAGAVETKPAKTGVAVEIKE